MSNGAIGPIAATTSVTSYADIQSLEGIKRAPDGVEKVAAQFESIFIDLWLKEMRAAAQELGGESYLSSPAVKTHQEMLDHQWAVHLAENGGLGLARLIEQQLGGAQPTAEPPDASTQAIGNAVDNSTKP